MLNNINHTFIVRIWLESRESAGEQSVWRGQVQHVLSNEKIYFQTFQEMLNFMKRYLVTDAPAMRDME